MDIRLEDLEVNGYKIYQDKRNFNFGIDAVMLANFALRENFGNKKVSKVFLCDLCSGSLPIPLIMHGKHKQYKIEKMIITAFEIDKDQVALSNKSIEYNNIKDDIVVYNDDINNIIKNKNKYKCFYEYFDILTVNPPYIKKNKGIVNLNDKKNIAKHEIKITFDEICKISSLLLKSNKKMYTINRTERFTEMVEIFSKYNFQIKKAQFIYPSINKKSNLVLIEAVKNGKIGIEILPPIIVFDENGKLTNMVNKIYGK